MGFKKMSHDLEKNGKFFLKSTNFPTKTKKEGSLQSARATSTVQGMDLVQLPT